MAIDTSLDKHNTAEARADYARRCRDLAAWQRIIGEHSSALYNTYLAELYEGKDTSWYLRLLDHKEKNR